MEKSLHREGLNFNIPSEKIHHADYLVNFQLFYRDIRNLQVLSTEDLDFIKTKTKDIPLPSFCTFAKVCLVCNNMFQHLSKEEFDALKNLKTNKSLMKNLTKVIR